MRKNDEKKNPVAAKKDDSQKNERIDSYLPEHQKPSE